MAEAISKPWTVCETSAVARRAVDVALSDPGLCRRLNVQLLRLHMRHMIEGSEVHTRAGKTIAHLERIGW
jgi:hypothetical protein